MSGVVFIDSHVQDRGRLLAGLAAGVQVVFLDPFQDGITQIAAVTAALTHLDSIRTNSHVSSSTLYLGSMVLIEENIDDGETQLSRIGASYSDAGDLLLYGCDAGAGATGQSFITRLGDFTRADVAASTDFATNNDGISRMKEPRSSIPAIIRPKPALDQESSRADSAILNSSEFGS